MAQHLSHDILAQTLELFYGDLLSLYYCTLVNRFWNIAASKQLYTHIRYSPKRRHVHDLKHRGLPEPSILASACMPGYASFVTQLEITGYTPTELPFSSILSSSIASAIETFINLSKIVFCPVTYHDRLFEESLAILPRLPNLRELTVNSACMNEHTTPLLTMVEGLDKLTLHSPGRVILDSLFTWLTRLSPNLKGVLLKDNCGSVTPGVLKSFTPRLHRNLRELTLGLSYSLTDGDVFSFLAQMPLLERLQLRYYLQLRTPKTRLHLTHLRSFTVSCIIPSARLEALALCKWIRRIITYSPIEHINLACDELNPGPSASFDSIIHHLVHRHYHTLQVLDLYHAYIGIDAFKALLKKLTRLEEITASVRKGALETFQEYSSHLHHLHTAAFRIRNAKMKRSLVDEELARKIILRASPAFRRLKVNGAEWEGSWKSNNDDGGVQFAIIRT